MRRFGLALSSALIVAVTLVPFGALQTDTAPKPWCLVCGRLWLSDAISNFVLFVPLGIALATHRVSALRVGAMCLACSFAIELSQSLGFPPLRSSALADVVTNTLGGLAGALLFQWRHLVFHCTPTSARWLSVASAAAAALLLTLTSAAFGARTAAGNAIQYRRSVFAYSPGHGWFGGLVDSATVNGFSVAHTASGPVVVEASAEPTRVAMTVTLRGRQDGSWFKPMLFVHRTGDTSAVAYIGERNLDAVLVITRRAWDWGLAMPSLTLPNVFAGRTTADPRPLRISALAATDHLTLAAHAAHYDGERTMPLVPTFGWALIQTFINVDSPFAVVVRVGWLALLVVPWAWWGARAGARWMVVSGALAGSLGLVLALLPRVFGVALVGVDEWIMMAVLLFGTSACSRYMLPTDRAAAPP